MLKKKTQLESGLFFTLFLNYALLKSFITSNIVDPSRAGESVTTTPAERNASIFPFAVPFPPDTIAPACPFIKKK